MFNINQPDCLSITQLYFKDTATDQTFKDENETSKIFSLPKPRTPYSPHYGAFRFFAEKGFSGDLIEAARSGNIQELAQALHNDETAFRKLDRAEFISLFRFLCQVSPEKNINLKPDNIKKAMHLAFPDAQYRFFRYVSWSTTPEDRTLHANIHF